MKLILLASCASALVVPPPVAQRRRDLPVAKGFYDEDDEHDEAPRPWEVGGVRLERLVTMTGVGAAAYTTYILGSEALDATMVKQLGISRSESVAAFGPFATLLGLVYSTILSNIYSFYLSRQELILSNLFAEAYAVRDLYELSGAIGNHSVSTTLALRAHALELRETGFRPSEDDGQRALGALVPVVAELEAAAAVEAPVPSQCPESLGPARRRRRDAYSTQELGKYFSSAYGRVAAARVARAASLATTLPRIFDLSFKAISTIVLASFLLVDLGSPQFEAILFAVLACSFYLLESFVDDLEDPFGGSWTVDAALDACDELVDALAVEE